jgi:hypothetical protein
MVGFLLRKIFGGTPKFRRNTVAKYWLDENPHLKAINNVPSWHFLSQNFAPFGRRSLSRRFAKGGNAPALNRALRRRRLPGLRFRKHRFYRDSVAQLAPGEGIARQPGYSGRPRSSPRPIQSNPAHSRSLYPNGSRSPGVPILSVRELYRRDLSDRQGYRQFGTEL